jgi:hypothetical protein
MDQQLDNFISSSPESHLGSRASSAAHSDEDDGACPAAPLPQDLQTEDVDAVPSGGPLWAAQPSEHDMSSTAAAHQVRPLAPNSTGTEEKAASPPLSNPSRQQTLAPVELPPGVQPSTKLPAPLSPPTVQLRAAAGTLRSRMQHTLMDEEDSEEEDDAAAKTKSNVLKKIGHVSMGKYKVAVESDSDDAPDADAAVDDQDLTEFSSILKKNRPLSAAADDALAQEAASAHAEDFWKPISVWSKAKPVSIVKSQLESAVLLSTLDLQLLQSAVASPLRPPRPPLLRAPAEAPSPSRMAQLPPERGRKWPLNNLVSAKAGHRALSGLQLTADDAAHLQDIENCIAQGGQITDELRDVRGKLRKLQPVPRAATQLKSSHTVASAELRSMAGDVPQRNPFLPPNYRGGRAATASEDTVPYDCIRLLQSYDTKAGTAQRLQEHDRMMSDLYASPFLASSLDAAASLTKYAGTMR